MTDPNQDARELSTNAISVMTQSVFGSILGPVVNEQLLDWLGLGSSDELADYMNQIEAQLAQMETQLVQLQTSLDQILSQEAVIEEQFSDVEVQQLLSNFVTQATTIKQNFQSYVDAITGLSSTDRKMQGEAIGDLFQLCGLVNMQSVAGAMTGAQQVFLPTLAEQRGLIDLQHDLVRGVIVDFAANVENYRIATNGPIVYPNGVSQADPRALPSGNGVFASGAIDGDGHNLAGNAMSTSIAGAFKAFLTLQTQGLILLNMAWLGSIHEDQITAQVTAIQAVLSAMKAFEAAVVATVDDQVALSLQTMGQRLTGLAASNNIRYDYGGGDVRMQYPLSDDWIMWGQSQFGLLSPSIVMVYQPWTYNTSTAAYLGLDTTQDAPHIFIGRSDDVRYPGMGITPVQAPRFGGIPTELQFVRNF